MINYTIGILQTREIPLAPGLYGEPFEMSNFLQQVFCYFSGIVAIIALTLVGEKPIAFNEAPKEDISVILPSFILGCLWQSYTSINM